MHEIDTERLFNVLRLCFKVFKSPQSRITRKLLENSAKLMCECAEISGKTSVEHNLIKSVAILWKERYFEWARDNPTDYPIELRNRVVMMADSKDEKILSPEEKFDQKISNSAEDIRFLRVLGIKT